MRAVKIPQFRFQLGKDQFVWDVFTTLMTDDVILGLDFLEHHGGQVDLEKHTVKIGDQLIQAQMRRENAEEIRVSRVTLVKRVVVPHVFMMYRCLYIKREDSDKT